MRNIYGIIKFHWNMDMFGNMFENDPADEMEEMSDSDEFHHGNIFSMKKRRNYHHHRSW